MRWGGVSLANAKPVKQADYSRLSNSMVTFEVIHLHGLKLSCSQQFHVLCLDAKGALALCLHGLGRDSLAVLCCAVYRFLARIISRMYRSYHRWGAG